MKDGGATIRMIPCEGREAGDLRRAMMGQAAAVVRNFGPEVAGFVVLAWDNEAQFSLGWELTPPSPVTLTLLPSWIADVMRRSLIETGAWE